VLQTPTRPDLTDLEELLAITALPEGRLGHVVVQVRGEIDTYTEPLLRACLRSQITRPAVTELVVDLRKVTFLGAAGVAALLSAQGSCRARGIRFAVRAGGKRQVLRPLELTGLMDLVQTDLPDAGSRPGYGRRRPSGRPAARPAHPRRRPRRAHR
jgi:anti-sigma B factor antagonist